MQGIFEYETKKELGRAGKYQNMVRTNDMMDEEQPLIPSHDTVTAKIASQGKDVISMRLGTQDAAQAHRDQPDETDDIVQELFGSTKKRICVNRDECFTKASLSTGEDDLAPSFHRDNIVHPNIPMGSWWQGVLDLFGPRKVVIPKDQLKTSIEDWTDKYFDLMDKHDQTGFIRMTDTTVISVKLVVLISQWKYSAFLKDDTVRVMHLASKEDKTTQPIVKPASGYFITINEANMLICLVKNLNSAAGDMDYKDWVKSVTDELETNSTPGASAHFRDNIYQLVSNVEYSSQDYLRTVRDAMPELKSNTNARMLDQFYAKLVKGAMVNTNIRVVWGPSDETENSMFDETEFSKILWRALDTVAGLDSLTGNKRKADIHTRYTKHPPDAEQTKRSDHAQEILDKHYKDNPHLKPQPLKPYYKYDQTVSQDEDKAHISSVQDAIDHTSRYAKMVENIKEIKKIMKNAWEESKEFRITNEVHMVEVEIMHRLSRDGAFHWLEDASCMNYSHEVKVDTFILAFIMRRDPLLRYQFAAAVGKRFITQRIVSTGR